LLFPPVEERAAYHHAILQEILQERVKRCLGRRTPRGVKRKMSRYPIRNSRTRKLRPLDFTALEILK
jgi:hypothetical protein